MTLIEMTQSNLDNAKPAALALIFGLVAGPYFSNFLGWQVATLDSREPGNVLTRFKSNHWVGVALTAALLAEWLV